MSERLVHERPPRFASWLIEPMRRNMDVYLKVALAAVMINLFGIATSLFTMVVYDRVVPNNAMASLTALSIGLGFVLVFDFVLRLLRAYFVDIAGANIDHEIGERVFAKLLALRMDARRGSTGALAGMMRELETLRDFFASATLVAIVDVPFILITLIVIAAIGGPVVIVPLITIPIVLLIGWLSHPAMDRLGARVMGEGMLKQSVLVEAIGGLEMAKTAGAGPLLSKRWLRALAQQSDSMLRQRLVSTIGITAATTANTISYAGVVIVGVNLIAERELTTGGLVACSILVGRAMAPLAQIAQLLSRVAATGAAYRQIDGVMKSPSEGPEGEALKLARVSGAIEFRDVAFSYPGTNGKALDHVGFSIAPGEHVAILGRVGSGKSTIARLILGLYEPQQGLVMIDGTDIRQLDPAQLRGHIGAAMQESVLLTGSVRENISLARPDVTDEELLRVSEMSGTHQFMSTIANGYDLRLADRGEGLSGGQRQSIAIARALAGSPAIILFDEPSSAMDAQTETALLQRLETELKGRTLILITHRPPLLQLVDRIILMDRGKVIADAPRDEVLRQLSKPQAA